MGRMATAAGVGEEDVGGQGGFSGTGCSRGERHFVYRANADAAGSELGRGHVRRLKANAASRAVLSMDAHPIWTAAAPLYSTKCGLGEPLILNLSRAEVSQKLDTQVSYDPTPKLKHRKSCRPTIACAEKFAGGCQHEAFAEQGAP